MATLSSITKRWAHRLGVAGAVVWWLYAFFSTKMFSEISATGMVLFLVGLAVVYAVVRFGVSGIVWLMMSSAANSPPADDERGE